MVHAQIGKVPRHPLWVDAQAPDDIVIECIDAENLPAGWDAQDGRRFGDQWIEEARSVVLVVPSVVTRAECNAVVNRRIRTRRA